VSLPLLVPIGGGELLITVTCMPDQATSYFLTAYRSVGLGGYPTLVDWLWGGIAISCPKQETVHLTAEIPFGELQQGKVQYGNLGDKDVLHLNAKGSIVVSGRMSKSVTPNPLAWGPNTVGREVNFGSTTALVNGIVPWGTSFSDERTFVCPRIKVSPYVGYRDVTTVRASQSLEFAKDGAVHIWHRPSYWNPLETQTPFWSDDLYIVEWYKRTILSDGTVRVLSSGPFTAKYDAAKPKDPYVVLPNGRRIYISEIGPDFSKFGVSCMMALTPIIPSGTGLEGGAVSSFYAVCESLRSPDIKNLVIRNFSISEPTDHLWGTLGDNILRQQNFVDASVLLTLFDLANLNVDIQSWVNLERLFKDLVKVLPSINNLGKFLEEFDSWGQLAAKAMLGVDYGILPTVSDTRKVFEGMHKLATYATKPSRYHARRSATEEGLLGTPVLSTYTLTADVSKLPQDFLGKTMEIIEGLYRWGVYPNFTMLLDFIPFSFAVNWFVNIQNATKAMDDVVRVQYFPINYCIFSHKRTWSPPLARLWSDVSVSGQVTFSNYDRYIDRYFPLPPVQIGESNGPFNHWAELGALIVTKGFYKR